MDAKKPEKTIESIFGVLLHPSKDMGIFFGLSEAREAREMSERTNNRAFYGRAAVVLALLCAALLLRLPGIAHEPFWGDEVYSVAFSDTSLFAVLDDNARDVHPPLYYLGLYAWRNAIGDSEIQMRFYSTVWSLIGLVAILLFAFDVGGWPVGITALILATLNAMDVYVAQEARMYAQGAALCTLTSWCLWRWMLACARSDGSRRWWGWAVGYALAALAAIHTLYLSVFVLLAQGVFALAWFGWRRKWVGLTAYLTAAVTVALAFIPWLMFVRSIRGALYNPALRWLQIPPAGDYVSFLGREFFWGQDKAMQRDWWLPPMILSVLVLATAGRGFFRAKPTEPPRAGDAPPLGIRYLFCLLALPVVLVAAASLVYHPVYFRPRFAQFLLAPFLILAAIVCHSFRSRAANWSITTALGVVMLLGTYVQGATYQKIQWLRFAELWKESGPPAGVVFFPRSLERSASHDLDRLIPSAVRTDVETSRPQIEGASLWVCSKIGYRFDRNGDDLDYYQWLLRLGSVRSIVLKPGLYLQIVRVGQRVVEEETEQQFAPLDVPGFIAGFNKSTQFHPLEY